MIHFYDSAAPQNVPCGVYAAVYVNGYAWPESQVKRMGKVIRISVHRDAFWAKYARVIDLEAGAAEPQDAVPFFETRLAHGFEDGTAYVNRSNWQEIYDRCHDGRLTTRHGKPWMPRFWVATLDGTQKPEGPGGIPWAVQYYGGMHTAYDLSVLHGINDFHRP